MREVKNTETGKVRLVPDATAEEIRKGKYLAKQGWVVVERTDPPFEVVKFQETKQVTEVKPEPVKVMEVIPEPVTSVKPEFEPLKMTVRQIQQNIKFFPHDQLLILAEDQRKSVSDMAKKRLKDG